jgi:hypothetical protein
MDAAFSTDAAVTGISVAVSVVTSFRAPGVVCADFVITTPFAAAGTVMSVLTGILLSICVARASKAVFVPDTLAAVT